VSTAPLEALIHAQRALIAALDADDVDGISEQTLAVDDALVRIRALAPRFTGSEAKSLVSEAITLADAARIRVNVLADMTTRRLTRLATATGKGNAAPTYGRNGRLGR
jgi:hypothetical protein